MARGDKSRYTDRQKREAEHIIAGYKEQGMSEVEAERIAWATVNKQDGGGKKSGSGRKSSDKRKSSPGPSPKSGSKSDAKKAGSKKTSKTK